MDDRIKAILARPYCRVLIPEADGVSAFIPDFRGCVSCGDTIEEAQRNLEAAAAAWLAAVLDRGQQVPEPSWYRKIPGLADVEPEEFEES